jgi:hypothetical protein
MKVFGEQALQGALEQAIKVCMAVSRERHIEIAVFGDPHVA